jgi:hypothetical protein
MEGWVGTGNEEGREDEGNGNGRESRSMYDTMFSNSNEKTSN